MPHCGRTAPSVKPNASDAANAQLILRSEIAETVLGTCIPTCPATIPLRARTSASSWVKRSYWWDPKMTGFWRFSSGFGRNRKNELSGTQSPLKVSFAGFLVERARPLVRSSGYPATRKRKNPLRLPALAAVIVDCISGGLCWSLVPCIRCEGYHQGAVGGAVHAHRADIVNCCMHRLPTLLSWPNLPVTAHRLAGGLSLPRLSA